MASEYSTCWKCGNTDSIIAGEPVWKDDESQFCDKINSVFTCEKCGTEWSVGFKCLPVSVGSIPKESSDETGNT